MMLNHRKIRLLMLMPNLHGGGAEKAVLTLYRSLDPNKFELSILAHEKWGSLLHDLDDSINIKFVHERKYKRTDIPGLLFATIHHAKSTDIILGANEGRATFFGLIAAKLLRKPIVGWLHNDWSQFRKLTSWRQILSLKLYGYFDRVVACSQGVADSFSKIVDLDSSRIQTIYNGISGDLIRQRTQEPLPDQFTSIFEQPTIITAGRLDYPKAQEYLIEAHAFLINKGIKHNLVILGQGGLLNSLKQQVNHLGVSNSVHFLGFQNNPHMFIKNATVFALSSRFEGFPLVIAETLFCGTPIVSTDCPSGPNEALEGGKYGILVIPEDPKALADGLEELLCNPTKRAKFSQLGLERSEAFEQKYIAREWESLFEEVAHSRGIGKSENFEEKFDR